MEVSHLLWIIGIMIAFSFLPGLIGGVLYEMSGESAIIPITAVVSYVGGGGFLIVMLNKVMNRPCPHCHTSPTEAAINRRCGKLLPAYQSEQPRTFLAKFRKFMNQVAMSTSGRNFFVVVILVCFGLVFIPLLSDVEILLQYTSDDIFGDLLGGVIKTSTVSFIDLFSVNSTLTTLFFIGAYAWIGAAFFSLLSQTRVYKVGVILSWIGAVCHVVAALMLTPSAIFEKMNYPEYLLDNGFTFTAPINGPKIALLALEILLLVAIHLAYEYDISKWLFSPSRNQPQANSETSEIQ